MKNIYLDVCTLCHPFDNQSIMRIRLETDAFYLILRGIQNGDYQMIVSPVHHAEIDDIEVFYERMELKALLEKYGKKKSFQLKEVQRRAEELYTLKFGVADAVHVAFAEKSSDYFITCDDKLLKKYRKMNFSLSVMDPVEFCVKEDLK